MSKLTAIIAADTTGFRKSVDEARKILEKFAKVEDEATQQLRKSYDVTNSQVNAYKRVTKILDKVTSGSISTAKAEKMLANEVRELKIQYANLSDTAKKSDFGKQLKRSSDDAERYLTQVRQQLQATNEELKQQSGISKLMPSQLSSITSKYGELGVKMGAVAVAAMGVYKVFRQNLDVTKELDTSLSKLQAINGVVGSMEGFREAAVRISAVVPQTAREVADAFVTVAQMKPELAKSSSELEKVTTAAIQLSNAAQSDLAPAVDYITRALNVYGYSADQAARISNVMAAGMRNGSGDVEWLGNAFGKVGGTARLANLSYEEVIATLEILSKTIKDSTSAGAQLRNILLYLEKQNDDNLKPSVVGLSKAIRNLRDANLSTSEAFNLTKKTSMEAYYALTTYADELEELIPKVTDTNTAFEMQQTSQDNLTGSINSLKSAWEAFIIELGDSAGAIKTTVDWLTKLINTMRGVNGEQDKFKNKWFAAYANEAKNYAKELLKAGEAEDEVRKKLLNWQTDKKGEVNRRANAYRNEGNEQSAIEWEGAALSLNQINVDSILKDAKSELDKNPVVIDVEEGDSLGVIEKLKAEIKELKKLANIATDPKDAAAYYDLIKQKQKELNQLMGVGGSSNSKQEKVKSLDLKVNPIVPVGETQKEIEDAIRKVKEKIKNTTSVVLRIKLEADLKDLEQKLRNFGKDPIKVEIETQANNLDLSGVKKAENNSTKNPIYVDSSDAIEDISDINDAAKSLYSTFKSFEDFEDMDFGEKFFTFTDAIFSTIEAINSFVSGIQSLMETMQTLSSISSALSQKKIAENTAEAGSEEMKSKASMKSAAANTFEAHSKIPFVGIAIAIGLIATMLATMSKFKDGGIVSGASKIGDMNLARVNSGEMILNSSQQAHLFKMINQGNASETTTSGEVHFKIQGKDLVGVLSNYNKKVGKVL